MPSTGLLSGIAAIEVPDVIEGIAPTVFDCLPVFVGASTLTAFGTTGFLGARALLILSFASAAFLSLAAFSSGDGTFRLILSFVIWDERASRSLALVSEFAESVDSRVACL